jgi:hypothetical protein
MKLWVGMYIGHIWLSALIVWIRNRARGSVLVAGFTHATIHTAQAFIIIQDFRSLELTSGASGLILILTDRM